MQNLVFLNKKILKIGIFIFPIIFVIITLPDLAIIEIENYAYSVFIREDGLIEYTTTVFYLLSSIFSILISVFFIKKEKKLFGILYLILFGFSIFMALEEINWGERIFDIQYPDFFTSRGAGQLNIHNLPGVNSTAIESIFWLVISFYGSFAWALFYRRRNKKDNLFVRNFIPNWYFAAYFLPTSLGNVLSILLSDSITSPLDIINKYDFFNLNNEIFEFLISVGILFFILSVFFRLKLGDLKGVESENNKEKKLTQRMVILIIIIVIIIPTFITMSVYSYDENFLLSDLYGKDLSDMYLASVDLSGKDLSRTVLNGTALDNANLEGADFSFAKMYYVTLKNANLKNAELSHITMINTDFSDAELSGADLSETIIKETVFSRANFKDANFMGADLNTIKADNANFENADFSRSTIIKLNLTNSNLSGSNFKAAKIYFVDFREADLSSVDFSSDENFATIITGSSLRNVDLREVTLTKVDFSAKYIVEVNANAKATVLSGVNLSGKDLTFTFFSLFDAKDEVLSEFEISELRDISVNLSHANLSRTNLEGNNLSFVIFDNADFSLANLKEVNFFQSDLSNVNLNGADLSSANLRYADLTKANLSFANLTNADLTNAVMKEVILTGTILDCLNHPICN